MKISITLYKVSILLCVFYAFGNYSCRKLVEVDAPVTSVNNENVYSSDATATSVLTGIYINMSNIGSLTGSSGISLISGLSADEFTLWNGSSANGLIAYYRNQILTISGADNWGPFYKYIFQCNAAIEGLNASNSLTPLVKKQLLAEAKFLRGFFYFYLMNLFGDVPLVVGTDPKINALLAKSSKAQIYQQIITDLNEAKDGLSSNYLDGNLKNYTGTFERVRPTKWAATALLARTYLFLGDLSHDQTNYAKAEEQSTAVINNTSLYALPSLNNTFLKNSNEAIWQIQTTIAKHNTEDAFVFILPATGPKASNPVYLGANLLSTFEIGDQRKNNWIASVTPTPPGTTTYYYPFKYKANTFATGSATEYLMILRLAEQYLIRAEARAQQNNISGSQSDLNAIRTRSGLSNTTASDKPLLLSAILHERQVELFTEWGHRWLDLKRTNTVDAVMSLVAPQKANGAAWNSYQQLYPIPLGDIQKNPNLIQNSGYQ